MTEQAFKLCMNLCRLCADSCDSCVIACENEANPIMKNCIALAMDAADFCRLTALYIGRNSEFISLVCQDCAEICNACAEECAQYDSAHCQACAEACRNCADECLRIGVA